MNNMTLEEALEMAEVIPFAEENKVITVDNDLRTITVPGAVSLLGVESDDEVLRLNWKMPKDYGEFDLSEFDIYINYQNEKNDGDAYPVSDKKVLDDYITFSWLVGRTAVISSGKTTFSVCMKKLDNAGNVIKEFNTTTVSLPVLGGLETVYKIVQKNPELFDQIVARLKILEETPVSEEVIAFAVSKHLAENPLTAEDVQARPDDWMPTAKEVGALPDDTEIPEVPDALPNPHALTIKQGNETITYNGYGAVEVTVPGENPMRIEKGSTDTVVELEAGDKYYVFPEMETLTYTITGEGEVHFFFQSGATPTEVVHPSGVNVGSLTVEANKIYEISVMENMLTYQSWAVS